MATEAAVLADTVQYYGEDTSRRAIKAGEACYCVLIDKGHYACSVGRYMIAPEDRPNSIPVETIPYLDELLKPEYRGLRMEFWEMLQELHDTDEYWDDDGLTAAGEQARSDIEAFTSS